MEGKFQRNFVLSVQDLDSAEVMTIGLPFTVKFAINRAFFGAANSATIQIYNLNADSRSFLRKDQNDFGFAKGLTLLAGYGDQLSTMLKGNVNVGYSTRQGVDVITNLQCFDGGAAFINSNFSGNFLQGTSSSTILRTLAKSLEQFGISAGAISQSFNTLKTSRGNAYSGNAIDIMNEITGGGVFIDNGIINAIRDNEYIKGDEMIISSRTGLLSKPVREWNNVTFNMLLEPRMYIGMKIRIEIGDKEFDGDYIVRALSHNGTISGAIGETAQTSITCTEAKNVVGLFQNG